MLSKEKQERRVTDLWNLPLAPLLKTGCGVPPVTLLLCCGQIVPVASGDRGNHDGGVYRRGRGEAVFDLCLTRDERDAVVSRTVEAFSLNQDQARLVWRCARWFRPTEAGTDVTGGDGVKIVGHGQGRGERDAKGGEDKDAAPVVLVHGVFGECEGTRTRSSLFCGVVTTVGDQ